MRKVFGLALGLAALLLSPVLTPAAPLESHYKGKTIRIVVAYPPGGAFDVVTRILARYLPKYLPGAPSVVVQNMPGGGGKIAPNHLFNVAKPDGMTFGNIHGAMAFVQMMKEPGVHFDVTRFEWIGSVSMGPVVMAIRSDLPIARPEQLREVQKPLYFAAAARQAYIPYLYPRLLQRYAGFRLEPILGYPGIGPALVALQRGEADARAGSPGGFASAVKEGTVRPIVRSPGDVPSLREVPVDRQFVRPEAHTLIDALNLPYMDVGRGYVAPPGTPPELLRVLRRAFVEAGRDPALIEELKKGFYVEGAEEIFDGENAAKAIGRLVSLSPATWSAISGLVDKP